MNQILEFDGERFTPEAVREIWYEHMHRYVFAARFVSGLRVLDAACGEGYGAAILSGAAREVTGVDSSEQAVQHARQRYASDNLEFRSADCTDLPFEDRSFDCIVSFETIEHLKEQERMLREFARVLDTSGFLLISSPDKAVYSDEQGFENPHHVRELYEDEFHALLSGQFPVVRMLGQKLMFHSAIWPLEKNLPESAAAGLAAHLHSHTSGEVAQPSRPVQKPMYLLAFCGANEEAIPKPGNALWLFDDAEESVYAHYRHEIRKNMEAGKLLAERDEALAKAQAAIAEGGQQNSPRRSWWSRFGLTRRRG
jgi:ubiquinone/menaquinone biosynthesis C-methylase UbiE